MRKKDRIEKVLKKFIACGYPNIRITIGSLRRGVAGNFFCGGNFVVKRGLTDKGVEVFEEPRIVIDHHCTGNFIEHTVAHELGHYVEFLNGKDHDEQFAEDFAYNLLK
jgi:hypothetical protein